MFKTNRLFFLYAETHLHPGAGEGLGHIDRVVQRDRATDLPVIWSSSLKGALRDHLASVPTPSGSGSGGGGGGGDAHDVDADQQAGGASASPPPKVATELDLVFGSGSFAGAASFVDARLLLLPVRSLRGTFAWITCPGTLAVLARDYALTQAALGAPPAITAALAAAAGLRGMQALVASLTSAVVLSGRTSVVLDDFCLTVTASTAVGALAGWLSTHAVSASTGDYWRTRLHGTPAADTVDSSLVIVSDDVFRDFTRSALEIVERNKLKDTGTTETMWTEELLPAHSLLYTPVLFTDAHDGPPPGVPGDAIGLAAWLTRELKSHDLAQLGANESLGRGLVRVSAVEPGAASGASNITPAALAGPMTVTGGPDIRATREQERATFAADEIENFETSVRAAHQHIDNAVRRERMVRDALEKLRKEYRSLVRSAPTMLRTAGLPAFLAFLLAKGADNGAPNAIKAEGILYIQLQDWLTRSRGGAPAVYAANGPRPHLRLFDAMRGGDSDILRWATREADGILGWQKRLATAMIAGEES